MTRKRRKTRSRQQLVAVELSGIRGQWKKYCRWFLFSRQMNMWAATSAGHGRSYLARELQRTKRCPICRRAPMQCPHITLDVFSELQERLVANPAEHRPWPISWAGRAP